MKKLFFIILIMLPVSVLATPVLTAPVVPSNLHIHDMDGNTYVDLIATGCSGKKFKLTTDHVKYDAFMSILISAQAAQKEVVGRFDECNENNVGMLIGLYLP